MGKARGSAIVAIAVICLLAAAFQCEAASFVVGDSTGWTMSIAPGWEKGKTFKTGDTLVFNYTKGKHNVVVVNKDGYDKCTTTPSDKVYTSGKDTITLVKGLNYFICSIPGHCAKMKLQISAS